MTRRSLSWQACLWTSAPLLFSASAIAAEAEHKAGLPQLNSASFPAQLFWGAVLFLVLYLLMTKYALPKVGEVIDERARRIGADLDEATRLQQEIDAGLASYEKSLSDARAEAQNILKGVTDELARSTATAQQALGSEIAAQTQEAESRIALAREGALDQVRSIAVAAAGAAASRLAGSEIESARVEAAVQAVAQEKR